MLFTIHYPPAQNVPAIQLGNRNKSMLPWWPIIPQVTNSKQTELCASIHPNYPTTSYRQQIYSQKATLACKCFAKRKKILRVQWIILAINNSVNFSTNIQINTTLCTGYKILIHGEGWGPTRTLPNIHLVLKWMKKIVTIQCCVVKSLIKHLIWIL